MSETETKDIFKKGDTVVKPIPVKDPKQETLDKLLAEAKAIVELAGQVEKMGHVSPSSPATKSDIDELRGAIKELTTVTGEMKGEWLKWRKAGKF